MSVDGEPAPRPAAHRRLGLVTMLYAYRAIAGILVALPIAVTLGAATSSYPRAQAELFDDGALMLLESLRLSRRAVPAVLWSGGSIALAAAAVGLLPLGALIAGLGRAGRVSVVSLFARAWAHAGTLALLFGLGLAMQLVAGSLLLLLGGRLVAATGIAPPAEDLVFLGLLFVIAIFVALVGVLRDLAYVAAVHRGDGLHAACTRAVQAFLRRPLRSSFAWAWRAALGLALLAAAAWLTPPGRTASAAAVALGLAIHQIALFGASFARASWLAAAIRALDEDGSPGRAQ